MSIGELYDNYVQMWRGGGSRGLSAFPVHISTIWVISLRNDQMWTAVINSPFEMIGPYVNEMLKAFYRAKVLYTTYPHRPFNVSI